MVENRIPPPLVTLALGTAMWAVAPDDPAPLGREIAAVGLFLAAGSLGFPALRAFRRLRTTIDPVRIDRASQLVTVGIYVRTRNLMYVGLVLLTGSWALWLGGLWVWGGPILLALWLDRFQIRPEERALSTRFGDQYLLYRSEVRRWL